MCVIDLYVEGDWCLVSLELFTSSLHDTRVTHYVLQSAFSAILTTTVFSSFFFKKLPSA